MTETLKAGRYELGAELGRGAMGVVYRAQDPVIGRAVAVKTVRLTEQATGMSHEELLDRFKTEARAAGLLTHPNIVVVYDAGEDDGLFYITMELVEGQSLQAQIDSRQSFPLPRVMRLMQQACSALDFAHQHRIVHRDIKPANLMLTPDDTLKITDFGTAKILKLGATQTAHTIGTPSYMSPEQIKGRPVDGRSDIFSLGVVLYELVTGQKPFPGESVTTVIYKIVNEEPVPPRELDSSIPPGLSAVIARALAKPVTARFQSGRELWEALQNYRGYAGPDATMVAAPVVQAAAGAVVPAMRPASVARPAAVTYPAQTNRLNSFWVALVSLAVIAAGGYRVWPALRDAWQRSHQTQMALRTPAQASSDATAPVAPQDQSGQTSTSPAAAEDAGQSEASAPEAQAPQADAKPAEALPPAAANVKPAIQTPVPAPVNAKATEAAPSAAESAPPKPRALPPSQVAVEWKGRIEQALAEAGIGNRVQVAAAGNNLTLTGALGPSAHSKLLEQLRGTPGTIHIIDDIGFADDAPVNNTTQNEVRGPRAASGGQGFALVRSNPPGAEIYVDGIDTGEKTPVRIGLPAGDHVVAFSLEGSEIGLKKVSIQPHQFSEVIYLFARQ